jgi:hypothetical protein
MATGSATKTLVLGCELGTDSKPTSTLFKGRARKFYAQSLSLTRVIRLPLPHFFAPILATRSNYRRISWYSTKNSSLDSALPMSRMRDVRLYDFFPLVQRLSFGQSVKRGFLFGCSPVRRFLIFNYDLVQCSCYRRFRLAPSRASIGRASSCARRVETVGERHV